jgi:hypothetical protein
MIVSTEVNKTLNLTVISKNIGENEYYKNVYRCGVGSSRPINTWISREYVEVKEVYINIVVLFRFLSQMHHSTDINL